MVWHWLVPGAQIVMLTNGMFGTLLTPASTVTRTALAATTCGEGEVLVTVGPADRLVVPELAEEPEPPEPPPPPPQALTSNASSAAHNKVTNEDV
ncbi:hypothetical protein GCM10011400_49080 [Paraburkholderia caffeinilytica]|uniref:Uncharacterized protein n=1 Tax=Paraburkholderia caffeinilytica TaxID=1761016 RepID=A0ABQ1N757_9BURK|nr:hypothetical protein GCM10011400_49080 [Paraburkholderia caffeinilytica]